MFPSSWGTRWETYRLKKPKKSGSEYYNYKGFFSLVVLALVEAEYRFFWVDVWSSGSSSDAQIFNCSEVRDKVKDGTSGLPTPKPLGEGGPDLHCFLLADNPFALMPWMVKPYSRRQRIREERITNYRIIQKQEGSGECIWNIIEQIQGDLLKEYFNYLGAFARQEGKI